jgi:hypothetical protein
MKKISYRNRGGEPPIKPTTDELPSVGKSDYSTESGGRSGFRFPGEPQTHDLPEEQVSNPVALIEEFVSTADDLDLLNMESEANFVDFLIKKFAEAINIEPSEEEKYIDYMYKLYNSDLPDAMAKAKTLSIVYSKKTLGGINSGLDKESAKKIAFNTELLRSKKDVE